MQPRTPPDTVAESFSQLLFGALTFRAYAAAVRLGIPDAVGDTSHRADELAAVLGADEHRLRRLLRALVALGVLRHTDDGRFALTAAGAGLRADDPTGTRGLVAFFGHPLMWRTFGALERSVREGTPAFTAVTGRGFFEYFAEDPSFAQSYHEGLHWGTEMTAPLIGMSRDWSDSRRIHDIGGGDGALLTALLAAHPYAHGIVQDSAEALEGLPANIRRHGVDGRCSAVPGDFLTEVPAGGDTYLLKNVLHEWGDDDCVRILGNCRTAMAEGARVLIVATLLPEPGPADGDQEAFTYAVLSDLLLMSASHGERTLAEYERLCAAAGLRITRVSPVPHLPNDNVIEAVAA
ncbi:hypothetical protein ACM01_01500 [Streptomyces viridochromogenes]|uniref:Uncharacterized protein n=1 Tax=Streptomyces viridochromogenes TaxID=1938 RepID=A0A0J8CH50_STRVR|nr:methyltransferase [Streptomyces viridochromogenes]KMS77330.1 hypothetical protein ACM01_01500 [Streptomyces viridochromogenes]